MNLFGRRDPEPSPSQRRQDTLARILEAQQIAGALTYHIKPSDIGAAKFDFMGGTMENPFSPCPSCRNVTFSRHGNCMVCGKPKPGEIGPNTPRVFDQRFMTRGQRQRRASILLGIFGIAMTVAVLYIAILLKAHR